MPKRLPTPSASSPPLNPMLKYFLIITLIILLGFTVVYIYNVVRFSRNLEKFDDVVQSPSKQVVLLYSTTCGHCDRFIQKWTPIVQKMQVEIKDVQFLKYEQSSAGAEQYLYNDQGVQINGFPTVLYVDSGKITKTLVGNVDDSELISFINRNAA